MKGECSSTMDINYTRSHTKRCPLCSIDFSLQYEWIEVGAPGGAHFERAATCLN